MGTVQIKRVYEEVESSDGYRVLVDRIWPRGESKEKADLDEWMKEIAPSTELRKWFGHDPAKMVEFTKRYRQELDENPQQIDHLKQLIQDHDVVTLVYSAKDEKDNQAVVLRDYLKGTAAS